VVVANGTTNGSDVSIDYLSGSNGHGTRQADAVRTDHRGAKNHGRCGVDRLPPMVFADTKRVESDLVGMLDVLDELPQPLGRIHGTAVLVERGSEAINPDLQGAPPRQKRSTAMTASANACGAS